MTPSKHTLMMDRQFITRKPELYDKTLPLIIVIVLSLHVLACIWIAYFDQTSTKRDIPQEVRRLTVQTISLQPSIKPPAASLDAATSKPVPIPQTAKTPKETPLQEALSHPKEITSPPITPPKLKLESQVVPKKPEAAPPAPPKPAKSKTTTATIPSKKIQPLKPVTTTKPTPSKTPPSKSPPAQSTTSKIESKPEPKAKAKSDPKISSQQAAKEAALKKQADEQAAQIRAAKERQQALINEAQERIAKIAPSHDKLLTNQTVASIEMTLPGSINNLKVDEFSDEGTTPFSAREASYRDELASRMKLLLRLPEYGDVRMKLTLDRTGKVINVTISSAQNANNRKYIEKKVPTLSFPPFGNHFGTEAQHTFSITLSNDW